MSVTFFGTIFSWNLLNSEPIGLSITVFLSEGFLQNFENHGIELPLNFGIAPDDDNHNNHHIHTGIKQRNSKSKSNWTIYQLISSST